MFKLSSDQLAQIRQDARRGTTHNPRSVIRSMLGSARCIAAQAEHPIILSPTGR